MGKGKSIITDTPVTFVTPPAQMGNAGWYVDRFENLIQTQGYDAYIDRALRCLVLIEILVRLFLLVKIAVVRVGFLLTEPKLG